MKTKIKICMPVIFLEILAIICTLILIAIEGTHNTPMEERYAEQQRKIDEILKEVGQ